MKEVFHIGSSHKMFATGTTANEDWHDRYDMDFGGMLYPSSTFIHDVSLAMTGEDLHPDIGTM